MTLTFWRRLSPATRVATGLVSLTISLVLLTNVFVQFLPDRLAEAKRRHATSASLVAAQIRYALRDKDDSALQRPLALALQHEPQLAAAAVVATDGRLLASVGDIDGGWTLQPADRPTVDNVRAPILAGDKPWGELRLVFKPTQPNDIASWLRDPLVRGMLLVALLGFVSFQLYLRRVLRYLDPDAAVPERVRTAFDTLTEAVLVLDADGNILMANQSFRELQPGFTDYLTGASIDSLAWLVAGLPESSDMVPWRIAMERNMPSLGHDVVIDMPNQRRRRLVMNCSPINDGDSKARGCLTTFSDVTDLEERTEHLRQTLVELNASQAEIEQKNQELILLATRDALTGCLNRGSFMAETDQRFAEAKAKGTPACVVMCDIDHFKQVNDKYGHAGGDRVIQAAVKAITRGLRVGDLLGRYGGEEFCIMLPGATMAQTLEIAERLRADVEANVGDAIREPANVKVTMSFGVAQLAAGTPDPATLIDLADQALYLSKKGGRNRVTSEAALRAAKTEPQTA